MFELSFDTENAAFEDENRPCEIQRILAEVASKVANDAQAGVVYDINGNRIGQWAIHGDSGVQP